MKDDDELWDNRELGANEKYVKVATDISEDEIDKALELETVTLRFKKSDLVHLQRLAQENHFSDYKTLIRFLVNQYINNPINLDINKTFHY